MNSAQDLYIDLLKKTIANVFYQGSGAPISPELIERAGEALQKVQELYGSEIASSSSKMAQLICQNNKFLLASYLAGMQKTAHSMTQKSGVDNVEYCVRTVLQEGIEGDFIETGVWRGGLTILMRGILKVFGVRDRRVWVADSFEGLPNPNKNLSLDDKLAYHLMESLDFLAVPLEQVKANFAAYGLLDEQVEFLKGYFCETLPKAPIKKLALMRLDGDWYESTMDALVNLYPVLEPGGICIIDDYGLPLGCQQAVDEYRSKHDINNEIVWVNDQTVYWRKF